MPPFGYSNKYHVYVLISFNPLHKGRLTPIVNLPLTGVMRLVQVRLPK